MQETHDNEIDVRELLASLRRGRWWIIASAMSFGLVFAIIALYTTPVFRASTVVGISQQAQGGSGLSSTLGQLGGLASLAGIDVGGADSQVEQALAVLRSREFTEKFIDEKKILPELFYDKWDRVAGTWKKSDDSPPTLPEGYKKFDGSVRSIARDKKTGLVTVSVDWRDPKLAAEWSNALVASLNSEMRSRAIVSSNESLRYLEKELGSTSTIETRQAIGRLIEAQINQRMLANVASEYIFRVVDRALPPLLIDRIKPKKLQMVMIGLAVGLIVGAFLALFINRRRPDVTR